MTISENNLNKKPWVIHEARFCSDVVKERGFILNLIGINLWDGNSPINWDVPGTNFDNYDFLNCKMSNEVSDYLKSKGAIETPKITFNVKHITILLTRGGTDQIIITTYSPTSFPEMKYDTTIRIDARRNYGEQWLKENFPGIAYNIVDTK